MKKIFLLFVFIIPFNIYSQEFKWGKPFKLENERKAKITYQYDQEAFVRIFSKYDLNKFNYNIKTSQFSTNELEMFEEVFFEPERPKNSLNFLKHKSLFRSNGDDYTFFLYENDKATKKNILHWQSVNIKSANRGILQSITSIPGKSTMNSGNYSIKQSDNKKFYAVLKEYPYYRKKNEVVELLLLDENKEIVKEIKYTFSIPDKRNKQNEIFVSNNGSVYIVKQVKLKKQKPYKLLYLWNQDTNELKEYSLKLDKNYQIYQFDIDFDSQNNLYFNGLYTYKGSTSIGFSIDFDGKHSGIAGMGIFSLKLSNQGEVMYKTSNEFDKIVPNLNLKDFVLKDDYIWFFMDKMYVTKKSLGNGTFNYDYTYQNTGIFIGSLNINSGKFDWYKDIEYEEKNTKNDHGEYLSFLYFIRDNGVVILFNDTKDIYRHLKPKQSPFYKRIPIKKVFDFHGNLLLSKELLEAGVGAKKDQGYDLDTSFFFQIDKDNYIIRAKNGSYYKYGYLTF